MINVVVWIFFYSHDYLKRLLNLDPPLYRQDKKVQRELGGRRRDGTNKNRKEKSRGHKKRTEQNRNMTRQIKCLLPLRTENGTLGDMGFRAKDTLIG